MSLNRTKLIAGSAMILLALAPAVWGAIHGVPVSSDKQAWFLACGASLADGVYRRRLGYETREYAMFFLTVISGYILAMWAGGFGRMSEPKIWIATVWVNLMAYYGTGFILRALPRRDITESQHGLVIDPHGTLMPEPTDENR